MITESSLRYCDVNSLSLEHGITYWS